MIRSFPLTTAACVVMALAPTLARAEDREPPAVAQARELRRSGRPGEAAALLGRVDPGSRKASDAIAVDLELARAYADLGDFNRTMNVCWRLDKVKGAKADEHLCGAIAQLIRKRASEALLETEAALALDSHSYDAKVAEARAYELGMQDKSAETSARDAIAWQPDGAPAHFVLGRVLAREGRAQDAVAELRRAASLDPRDPEALLALGLALPPGPESVEWLERATRQRPALVAAHVALAKQFMSAGSVDAAKTEADSALAHDPKCAGARLVLGQIALSAGRVDEAIGAGRAVLNVVPNSAEAMLLVAAGQARKGDVDLALESYQAAWGSDHGDPAPLVHASTAAHAAGRDTSAKAFAARATEEFPAWAPGWAALGDALAARGETEGARTAYEKALGAGQGSLDRAEVLQRVAALPRPGVDARPSASR